MIIKDLIDYYDCIVNDKSIQDNEHFAPVGMKIFEPSFRLNIDDEGNLVSVEDIRIYDENKPNYSYAQKIKMHYPLSIVRNGIQPILFCDNLKNMFGKEYKSGKFNDFSDYKEAYKEKHLEFLENINSTEAEVLKKYFNKYDENMEKGLQLLNLKYDENGKLTKDSEEKFKRNFILFYSSYNNEPGYFHEFKEIKNALKKLKYKELYKGKCIITGEETDRVRTHDKIKLSGVSMGGCPLISYNECPSVNFKGIDAQTDLMMSLETMQKYTSTLNYLLMDPLHHFRINELTAVIWTTGVEEERAVSDIALQFAMGLISGKNYNEETANIDDDTTENILAVLKQCKYGKDVITKLSIDDSVQVHLALLRPNSSRIVITQYYTDNIENFLNRIYQYYDDMNLECAYDVPFPNISKILELSNAPSKSTHATFGEKLFYSIINNKQLPESLLNGIIERYKIEYSFDNDEKKKYIKSVELIQREKFIKAGYIRKKGGIQMDNTNKSIYFTLGRIFAVCESICFYNNSDSYQVSKLFKSYVNSPARTMSSLIPKIKMYISKLYHSEKGGIAHNLEKLLNELLSEIDNIPVRTNTIQQSEIILGHAYEKSIIMNKKTNGKEEDNNEILD